VTSIGCTLLWLNVHPKSERVEDWRPGQAKAARTCQCSMSRTVLKGCITCLMILTAAPALLVDFD